MDELAKQSEQYLLSEELLQQLQPIVRELAQQEQEAQRLQLVGKALQAHLRMLISQSIGVPLAADQSLQLNMKRGFVTLS